MDFPPLPPPRSFSSGHSLYAPSSSSSALGLGSSFRDQLRAAATKARMRASRVRSSASSAITRHTTGDGPVAMVSQNAGVLAGGVAIGAMNSSVFGQKFTGWAHGLIQPSTALFAAGFLARAFNVDRKFPRVRAMNSTFMRASFPIIGVSIGEGLMAFAKKHMGSSTPAAHAQLSGAPASAATPAAEREPANATRV